MTRPRRIVRVVALAAICVCCNAISGVDDLSFEAGSGAGGGAGTSTGAAAGSTMVGGAGGGPAGAGGGGGTGGGGGPCPAGMTVVDAPAWSFCIDELEVTRQQYQAFLDSPPSPSDPGAECSWNDSLLPANAGNECDPTDYDPANNPDRPVVCVDWCDARAYCTAMNKRLCGKIGTGRIGGCQAAMPRRRPGSASHVRQRLGVGERLRNGP